MGVLAFGDSITNGGGELQWGVALQSWALWVARGLGVPYTGCAFDGATATDVVRRQIPDFRGRTAVPEARYQLGCLYVGVNDVRALDWDPVSFAADHERALSFLRERCDRVLAVTAPLDLGRPRAGARVHELNAIVADNAKRLGALVLDLSAFGARNQVMTDHVHPTAFGQVAIAERALAVLERDGLGSMVRPSTMIAWETTRWKRLRGDVTYVYRHAKVSGRALRIRATAAARRPPSARAGGGPADA